MDGHDRDHRLLAGFLAGDLDPAAARRRGLADRVAFAVEIAAAGRGAGRPWRRPGARSRRLVRPGNRLGWQRIAGAGVLVAGLAVTLAVLLFPGGPQTRSVPAAVAAVARYAEAIPSPAREWLPRPGGAG